MRAAVVVILLLAALAQGVQMPAGREVLEAVPQGSVGGILVGLFMCLPVFGVGALFVGFVRWHRRFHARMSTTGFRRPR